MIGRLASTTLVGLSLSFAGCNDDVASQGLSNVEPLALGDASCPHGGARISTGLDRNGDGVLATEEIERTVTVCSGGDGTNGLIATEAEPQGANCGAGGQKLSVGQDDGANGGIAGNGLLEAGEIRSVNYLCNGLSSDAISTLVVVSAEPQGVACSAGGQRIDRGLDDGAGGAVASDGVLDPSEIDSTSYVCNGAAGAPGVPGSAALVEVIVEPQGANCTDGGSSVRTGLDDGAGGGIAGDGALQSGEVRSSQFVCNGARGAAGFPSLVNLVPEAAGANCANGGQRADVGLDDGLPTGTAGDGVLQPGEIVATRYICNGASGAPGTSGFSTLVRTATETAGVNCANGGTRIQTGLDDGLPSGIARNEQLEAGEIESTQYVCNSTENALGIVRDASGATLGTAMAVSSEAIQVRSSTGYFFTISWAGTFPNQQLYYGAGNCTGTPVYLSAGTTIPKNYNAKYLVYEGATGAFFTVSAPDANGNKLSATITGAAGFYTSAGGVWSCQAASPNGGWPLTSITRANTGIPATIALPLSIQ